MPRGSLDRSMAIVFVSFERDHRIWRYAFGKSGLPGEAVKVATPPELASAPENGGLEAIGRLSDGRLLAMTESFHDAAVTFAVVAGGRRCPCWVDVEAACAVSI